MSLQSEDVTVYDRQIRLWGRSAQASLLQAQCYVSSLSRVHAEICKCLVTLGIHLTLCDSTTVNTESLPLIHNSKNMESKALHLASGLDCVNATRTTRVVLSPDDTKYVVAVLDWREHIDTASAIVKLANSKSAVYITIAPADDSITDDTLFSLDPSFDGVIGDSIPPALSAIVGGFAAHQITYICQGKLLEWDILKIDKATLATTAYFRGPTRKPTALETVIVSSDEET